MGCQDSITLLSLGPGRRTPCDQSGMVHEMVIVRASSPAALPKVTAVHSPGPVGVIVNGLVVVAAPPPPLVEATVVLVVVVGEFVLLLPPPHAVAATASTRTNAHADRTGAGDRAIAAAN